MAKGNAFLGTLSGKVGDVVFYRKDGQQMARAYQPDVRDANTNGQRLQRAIMSNVTKIINTMRPQIETLVQHKQDKRRAIAYLISRSMRYQRNFAVNYWQRHREEWQPLVTTPVPLGVEMCPEIVPSSVIVSKGSLSQRCFLAPPPGQDGTEFYFTSGYDPILSPLPLSTFAEVSDLEDGDYYHFLALTTDPNNRVWQDESRNLFIEKVYYDYVTLQVKEGVRDDSSLFVRWPQAFNVVDASTPIAREYFRGLMSGTINTWQWTQGGRIRGTNLYAGSVAVVRSKQDGRCSTAWMAAAWQKETAEVSGISANFIPAYWGNI